MDQVTFADVLQKSFIAMSMGGTDRITTLNIIINISMSFFIGPNRYASQNTGRFGKNQ